MNWILLTLLIVSGFAALPVHAQTVIIGDTGVEIVNVPPSIIGPVDTLILGNTASGDGTLNFSAGALNVAHAGGYSGFVTVGNSGIGTINHDNANGDAVINITGPQYAGPPPGILPDPWGGYLFLGRNDGSSGSYTITDAGTGFNLQLTVQNEIQIGGSNVSTDPGGGFSCFASCTGSFLQDGGTVTAGAVVLGINIGVGTYTINSGTLNANNVDLGNTSSGDNRFTQNGGTVNLGSMFIANGVGSNGTYTLNGGDLNSGSFALIGLQGTGAFTQTGGVHNANDVSLGFQATGTGTYELSGGTFNVGTATTGSLLVGDNGQGVFNMTGGTLTIFNNDIATAAFVVGNHAGSVGTFTQSGGDVFGGRALAIGLDGGTGTYNLNTDLVNGSTPTLTTGFIALGNNSGQGTFNQQAGTSNTTGSLFIGQQGTYNLDGGSLNVDTGGQGTIVGTSGVGALFNQSGGTHTANTVVVGNRSDASGTYVMAGGDLVVNGLLFVGKGDNSLNPTLLNGLFQQSGGTVTAAQIFIGGYTDFSDPMNPISHFGTGRYELSDGTLNSQFTAVGWLGQGRILQTGGTFNNTGELQLGSAGLFSVPDGNGGFTFYSSGTYDLQGGILNTGSTTVSVFGQGTFNQSGISEHRVTNNLSVGSQPGLIEPISGVARQGIYAMTGGTLDVGGNTIVAAGNDGFVGEPGAIGTFTQSGGTHTTTDLLVGAFGSIGGGTGAYTINANDGPSVLTVNGSLILGQGGPCLGCTGATGNFNQAGGTVNVGSFLTVAEGVLTTGNYTLSGGTLNVGDVTVVGVDGVGTFIQTGGTHNTGFLDVGFFGTTGNGTYNLVAGNVNIANNLVLGNGSATGTFNQSGGNVAVNSPGFGLFVNNGTYNLSGGNLTVVNNSYVGDAFSGGFVQSGGMHSVGNSLIVGNQAGVTGTYDLSGTGTLQAQGAIIGDAGTGVMSTSGSGVHTIVGGDLVLGNQTTGNGTYNLSGTASLSVNDTDKRIIVGAAGTGTFNQTGGTATAYGLSVGNNAGGNGHYTLSAGALNVTGLTGNGRSVVGATGTGVFDQSGGTHTTTQLVIGNNAGGNGTYNLSGGTLSAGSAIVNAGGATGTLNYSGGSLSLGGGTGTLTNNAGGQVNFSGAGTRVVDGNLTNSGAVVLTTAAQVNVLAQTGGTINLNANNLTVTKDYTNSSSGSGNNFNARAGVTGAGQIVGLNASQTITGDAAAAGANTWTLNFGSMRGGGSSTVNYQIANNGTGADIRGAIQTGAPGLGNITDARLSGTGVPTGGANFGAIAAGANSGNLSVTFNAGAGGGSLAGQNIAVVSNFGNVATQFINLAGNADTLAVGNATPNNPPVVNLGNFHVGGAQPAQNFAVQNTAAGTLATTERLGIATATATGNFNATNNLGAGFINPGNTQTNAVSAAVSGGAAGVNNGTLNIQYTTNGVLIDPTYTTINANLQSINLTAAGYNLAAGAVTPNPITVANQRINATNTAALTVANAAPVNATFTETLSANFANANTGDATNNGGAVSGIAGGGNNNTLMKVGVDATSPGAKTGTVTLNLTSNEVNASGLGNTTLAPQIVTVNGNVYQAAVGQLNAPTSLNFGTVQVNQVVMQTLSITNAATGPLGFVEDLSASFGASTGTGASKISGTGTIGTLLAGATNATNMVVHVDTTAAANINGNIAVNYFTNGAVNGVSNGLGIAAAGTDPFGVIGTIAGQIVDQANPVINNPNINLGNVRQNAASPTALVSVTNQATGNQQAALNASISAVAPITASGSFNQLLPGNTSPGQAGIGTLQVGMNTATAGHISGMATVALVSDAANIGNCAPNCQMTLASQTVNVSGDVYRLANPLVNTASPITLAARVNDASPQAAISITNSSPDQYREGLNVVRGTTAIGFVSSGSITNLAAQQTSTAIQVSLNTAAAGHVGGTQVLLFASDGTLTNAPNVGLTQAIITLSGNVYQAAAGAIQTAALNFGTVQVNQVVSQNLVIRNTAAGPNGFVEDLNSAFGSSTDARILGAGSLNSILAGTNSTVGNGTMTVSINTGAAGTVNGSIRVNYTTAGAVNGVSNGLGTLGVGGEDYAAAGTIVQGNVVDQAKPVINGIANPGSVTVNLGNVRINTAANQTLTVLNQATGNQQAALNASIASDGAPVTASGSFNQLLPGNSSPGQAGIGTLQVGINTSVAGTRSGTATVTLVSDATNIGGCAPNCAMNLPSQTVNVSGDVYRLANPLINTASPINLAGRVGGVGDTTRLTGVISITNSSPDQFTEGLDVSRGATPAGFASSGSIINLAAQQTSTAIQVSLNTAAAGHVAGTQVLQFASNGTITGNTNAPLPDGSIQLSGNVYTPAVAQVTSSTPINFGIVHVGDAAPSAQLTVKNNAPVTALNDTLLMSFASATGGFTGSGNLGLVGLGAQESDSTSLSVAMNTSTAGVYSGHATFNAASHDGELADFNLADVDVDLQGQVNNYALAAFRKNTGSGVFSGGGTSYLLDFGQLLQGANGGHLLANLGVFNNVLGPADVLAGSFQFLDPIDFGETGFNPFSGLLAGAGFDLLNVDFNTAVLGTFQDEIRLTWSGSNASGYQGPDNFILLTLRANVIQQGTVPEPGTLWLMLLCLTALAYSASRRARPVRH